MKRLLCLSNGHGEDEIAVRILRAWQQLPDAPEIVALPIVGEGYAYTKLKIPILAPVQSLPSGGFIYMDGRQLLRDLQGGLVGLTWAQLRAVRTWARQGGKILAVGDLVPLLFAWWSGAAYGFVGTAKSEYYLRDQAGPLPRSNLWQRWEGWSGSVYLPWERWLMAHPRCQAVFPRDRLTAAVLQQWPIPVFDLGNPMMDGLTPEAAVKPTSQEDSDGLKILLLPGSRPPEAYANWRLLLAAGAALLAQVDQFDQFLESTRSLEFLAAIAPRLDLAPVIQILQEAGWHNTPLPPQTPLSDSSALTFRQGEATLILTQQAFKDCLHRADLAIALAGTATEQFVGLGKPVVTFPGPGPQFTPRFAEAQQRLLGPSVILVAHPSQVPAAIKDLLTQGDRLRLIRQNGQERMGSGGAAQRIATCLQKRLL